MPAIRTILTTKPPYIPPMATVPKLLSTKRRIRQLLKERAQISIEVGSGNKRGAGDWLTLDLAPACDLYWDLRMGIPFPDNRVNSIYSSHFFEHLTFTQITAFLQECKRVLVPGGEFIICVPNARVYLEAYVNGETLPCPPYFGYEPAYNNTTPIDAVNYTAYMDGEHKYMFDEQNLIFILNSAGFKNARLRDFDPAVDMRERDFESIYARAER